MRTKDLICFTLLILILFFGSCISKESKSYVVLETNCTSSETCKAIIPGNTVRIENIKLGDQDYILLEDIKENIIFQYDNNSGQKNISTAGAMQFNSKYFDLVVNNLNAKEQSIRQTVFGGVHRGISPINIIQGQAYYNSELIINCISNECDCTHQILVEDEVIKICDENTGCTMDLKSYRKKDQNQDLLIVSKCAERKFETRVTILSEVTAESIKMELKTLKELDYPKLAYTNLYLKYKLHDDLKNHLATHKSNHPLNKKLKKIYNLK